jgi:GWxTD domain-containing protein
MRSSFLAAYLSVLLVLVSVGTGSGTAMRGSGDFEFYVDIAPLPHTGSETIELVQIAIPSKEIEFVERAGRYEASFEIHLVFRPEEGESFERRFVVVDRRGDLPMAKDISEFIYVADTSYVAPGLYEFEVRIKDLNRKKKTLVGMLRKEYLYSELKDVYVEVPSFEIDRFSLSDPVLAWRIHEDRGFIPNPMGIYGLRNDTLAFFLKARVPEGLAADSIDLYINIVDQAGELFAENRKSLPVEDGEGVFYAAFDLNSFPANSYHINAVAFCEGMRASRGKDFSVSWELLSWQKPVRDLLVEARLLLPDRDFEQFQYWTLGEQESYLNAYWKKSDPTPHTAVNETYDEFMRRLQFADSNYGVYRRGALSDRGLMFIRFGQPDAVEQQPLPFNREDVSEAMEQLEDKYKVITHSTSTDGITAPQARIIMEGKSSPFRGDGFDAGSYELWIYNLKGEPIFERDRLMTIKTGLRFLFVDMDGVGEYKLVGTSEEYIE